jgi:hypothetical protein
MHESIHFHSCPFKIWNFAIMHQCIQWMNRCKLKCSGSSLTRRKHDPVHSVDVPMHVDFLILEKSLFNVQKHVRSYTTPTKLNNI